MKNLIYTVFAQESAVSKGVADKVVHKDNTVELEIILFVANLKLH